MQNPGPRPISRLCPQLWIQFLQLKISSTVYIFAKYCWILLNAQVIKVFRSTLVILNFHSMSPSRRRLAYSLARIALTRSSFSLDAAKALR